MTPLKGLEKTKSGATKRASQVALVVKNLHANAGDLRDAGIFLNYSFLQRYVQEWDFKTICAMCYVT